MTAETIAFAAFVLLIIIMYYKNKSEVKKRLAHMKKATHNSMTKKTKPNMKRSAKKKSFYNKEHSKPTP